MSRDLAKRLRKVASMVDAQPIKLMASIEVTAAGTAYYEFLADADEAFLKGAVAGIKKTAGGYAEKVQVMRSRHTVWLEYTGQDRSDMDFEIAFNIVMSGPSANDVLLMWHGKKAMGGFFSEEKKYKIGVLTTQTVVDTFKNYFG